MLFVGSSGGWSIRSYLVGFRFRKEYWRVWRMGCLTGAILVTERVVRSGKAAVLGRQEPTSFIVWGSEPNSDVNSCTKHDAVVNDFGSYSTSSSTCYPGSIVPCKSETNVKSGWGFKISILYSKATCEEFWSLIDFLYTDPIWHLVPNSKVLGTVHLIKG